MRKRRAIGIAAAVALLAQQNISLAQPTAPIMQGCRGDSNDRDLVRWCYGIIGGALYYAPIIKICAPADATHEQAVEQAVRLVTLYIDRRPERMNEDFAKLVIEALQQAWPCSRWP
jgi:hypothetical protein